MIGSAVPEIGAYTQHYFDSRGVVRLYAMTFVGGCGRSRGSRPTSRPLDFRPRFTGTFSKDGNSISGAWEKGAADGRHALRADSLSPSGR